MFGGRLARGDSGVTNYILYTTFSKRIYTLYAGNGVVVVVGADCVGDLALVVVVVAARVDDTPEFSTIKNSLFRIGFSEQRRRGHPKHRKVCGF